MIGIRFVVPTPTSQRIDRVVNDICSLQHDRSVKAQARATRWIAHVLQDITSRRRWPFLDAVSSTMLAGGADVVELRGHIDKVSAIYCGERLEKVSLSHITQLRQAAAANSSPNAGQPRLYAIEWRNGATRIHLWPAPTESYSTNFTANATTDLLTVASNTNLPTGRRVRVSTTDTLPAPLAVDTTYFIYRPAGTTTVKLCTTLANAQAGIGIDLTTAGTGTHSLLYGMTPFAAVYTRPMDLTIVPNLFETIVVNGVLGQFGRHFDRDQLMDNPEEFERRYESQINRAASDSWDIEKIHMWEPDDTLTGTQNLSSDAGTATAHTVPASLTGIGYVTIETGDYPLEVG